MDALPPRASPPAPTPPIAAAAVDDAAAAPAPPPYFVHPVLRSDSIVGLSFRYGISPAEIRLANDLPSDNIHTVRELRIPRGRAVPLPSRAAGEDTQAAAVRRFRVTHRLTPAEARYYLSESEWDETRAAALLASELAWEAAHPQEMARAVSSATVAPRGAVGASAAGSGGRGGGRGDAAPPPRGAPSGSSANSSGDEAAAPLLARRPAMVMGGAPQLGGDGGGGAGAGGGGGSGQHPGAVLRQRRRGQSEHEA